MWTLADLLNPAVLQRIYDAELKSAADNKFTAAEFIKTLRNVVWNELDKPPQPGHGDANPYISSIRRNLQRSYLDIVLSYARQPAGAAMSADLTSMMRQSLRHLLEMIAGVSDAENLDFASKAHLIDCRSRIQRALEAQFSDRYRGCSLISRPCRARSSSIARISSSRNCRCTSRPATARTHIFSSRSAA
jgi:hypothetical protein